MFPEKIFLGLALGQHSASVAEITCQRKNIQVRQTACWSYPEGGKFSPSSGRSFREFLRQNHFRTTRVIAGLPLSWLLVKEKETPPAETLTLAKLVRLEAEKDFTIPAEELCLDFISNFLSGEKPCLLVIALLRQRLQEVTVFIRAAGLTPVAVVPSFLGLSNLLSGDGPELFLYLNQEEMLLAQVMDKAVVRVHRLERPVLRKEDDEIAAWKNYLLARWRRVFLLAPEQLQKPAAGKLTVFDDLGVNPSVWSALETSLNIPVIKEDLPPGTAAATGLGTLGNSLASLPVNFLHPKTSLPKKSGRFRKMAYLFYGLAAAGLLAAGALWSLKQEEKTVLQLKQRLKTLEEETAGTRKIMEQLQGVQRWQKTRPGWLDCLREITLCFPPEGGLWATSLAFQADRRGLLTGKAENEMLVLELLNRLRTVRLFQEVNLVYLRQAGGQSRQVSFAFNFLLKQATPSEEKAEPRGTP